jgi:hypothetical protein
VVVGGLIFLDSAGAHGVSLRNSWGVSLRNSWGLRVLWVRLWVLHRTPLRHVSRGSTARGVMPGPHESNANKVVPQAEMVGKAGAGGGNRTRVISLEGWSSTIELRPLYGVVINELRIIQTH